MWALILRPVRLRVPSLPNPRRAWRQLRLAASLAGAELVPALSAVADGAVALGQALVPSRLRFPVALLAYLLLVFALEVVFLRTFMPMTGVPAPAPVRALAAEDADGAEAVMAVVAPALPSAFHARLAADELMGGDVRRFGGADPVLADAPEPVEHALLRLPAPAADPAPVVYDSVRMAVARSSVRMPVDPRAAHPLDRAGFLATATGTTRLRTLFARVDAPGPAATLLAQRPKTAIAPPLTRLDRLRILQAGNRRLGSLCALFESGVRGIFAVGFDPKGGTSYGKYQISSRKGAMGTFLGYLDRRAPSWAMRLRSCGPSDTGGTGGAMPREWKKIASEHPRLFEKLQDDFIHTRYYSPSLNELRARAGLDLDQHPEVVREVLWSTAVQHGPSGGANIFIKASLRARSNPDKSYAVSLLEEVFRERAIRLARFPGRQRSALQARLRQEKDMAMGRLRTAAAAKTSALTRHTERLM